MKICLCCLKSSFPFSYTAMLSFYNTCILFYNCFCVFRGCTCYSVEIFHTSFFNGFFDFIHFIIRILNSVCWNLLFFSSFIIVRRLSKCQNCSFPILNCRVSRHESEDISCHFNLGIRIGSFLSLFKASMAATQWYLFEVLMGLLLAFSKMLFFSSLLHSIISLWVRFYRGLFHLTSPSSC